MIGNGDPRPGGRDPPRRWRLRPRRSPGRRRASTAWKVTGWVAGALVLLLVAGSLTAYIKYRDVWNSVHRVQVSGLGKRPPRYNTNALNILLIGSDSRGGANSQFGAGISGQRSDTIMILHISPGHHGATVISIPRDSMVPYVACPAAGPGAPGQQAAPGQTERINATFASGGPGCLWKTVEQETGIRIDHFIELTFTGFERVINDIGGVNICLPEAVNDPDSGLRLTAGLHHVGGAEALAFWRERHIGTGSDLQRIQRDQFLMASLLQGIAHSDILGSPARIYSVVVDAAGAMTTDTGLDLGTMLRIAESLRGLSTNSVQFVQVPEVPYPGDPQAEVMFEQPQASELFRAISYDQTPPGPARAARSGPRPAGPAASSPSAAQPSAPPPSARPSGSRPASPSPSPPVSGLNKKYGGINGSAQVCHDHGAFTGGDAPANFPSPLTRAARPSRASTPGCAPGLAAHRRTPARPRTGPARTATPPATAATTPGI
jgi:LCP family protein required for cell wall assembly